MPCLTGLCCATDTIDSPDVCSVHVCTSSLIHTVHGNKCVNIKITS